MATKKKAAQSVRKKATKKTSKKAARKTVSKKRKNEITKSAHTEPLGRVSIADETNKRAAKSKVAKTPPSTPGTRSGLMLLSPLRYPLQYDGLIAQTARVSGLVFVMLGAMLTFVNIQEINIAGGFTQTVPQQAIMTAATSDSLHTTTDTNTMDREPTVDFLLPAGDEYSGTVEIEYVVANAENIKAGVFYRDEGRYISFGEPERVADNRWKYMWDTSNYSDGEYRFVAIVTNEYGTYDVKNSSYSVVNNHSGIDPVATSSEELDIVDESQTLDDSLPDTESATDTVTQENSEESNAYIELTRAPDDHEKVIVTVEVPQADEVDLYAKNKDLRNIDRIGEAYYEGNNTWKYVWDTTEKESGEYEIYASIKNSYSEYESDRIALTLKEQEVSNNLVVEETVKTDPVRIEDTSEPITVLKPDVTLEIPNSQNMSDDEEMRIYVNQAQFIELYVVQNYGLTPHFLGLARKHDANEWRFRMDTTQAPNGSYEIFARVKNEFGLYDSKPVFVHIFNEVKTDHSFQEKLYIEQIKKTDTATTANETGLKEVQTRESNILESEELVDRTEKAEIENKLARFRTQARSFMDQFASAKRNEDAEEMKRIEQKITNTKANLIDEIGTFAISKKLVSDINEYLDEIEAALRKQSERDEAILRERVGEKVFKDSDNDGISDYDEINLYRTDPFVADSDGDGFIDGAEVRSGFNPTDSVAEALVEYESPKERGVVREDILTVESIVSLDRSFDDTATNSAPPVAIINGKALPNSYVTLHIFSTPIVVTVRTGDDGSWSYTFDKELENGDHEVYASVTDNAGRIIAKSNPFSFVKTAEAFTVANATGNETVSPPDTSGTYTILSQNTLLAVTSASVVVLGLILLLLGMHVRERQQTNIAF